MEGIDERITWTVSQIDKRLADPLDVTDLATSVNLSPSRFAFLFRRDMGMSPARFVRARRLDRARELLETTFLSVKEVMGLVGYNDPSHFARDFRRLHGAPPTAFRGRGVTADGGADGDGDGAHGSSVDPPTLKRIRPPRARDPGVRCA